MGIFSITIALSFIGLGAFVVFADTFDYISLNLRIIFSVLMFVYGAFRITSIYFKVNTGNQLIDSSDD